MSEIAWIALLILLVIIVIILIRIWKRKTVVVASLAIATDKDHYGREETVKITGDLNVAGEPEEGQTVEITITPPSEETDKIELSATTDADGKFAVEWPIPSDAEGGVYTLDVTCLGVKATRTFTLSQIG